MEDEEIKKDDNNTDFDNEKSKKMEPIYQRWGPVNWLTAGFSSRVGSS